MYSLYAEIEDYIVSIRVTLKDDFKKTCLKIADYYKNEGLIPIYYLQHVMQTIMKLS